MQMLKLWAVSNDPEPSPGPCKHANLVTISSTRSKLHDNVLRCMQSTVGNVSSMVCIQLVYFRNVYFNAEMSSLLWKSKLRNVWGQAFLHCGDVIAHAQEQESVNKLCCLGEVKSRWQV